MPLSGQPICRNAPGTIVACAPLDGTLDASALTRATWSCSTRARASGIGRSRADRSVAGHIPGARNRWFKENFDERGFWKSPERLRAELAEHGSPDQIVHYCGSGVSAAVNLLAYAVAGHTGGRVYPGGWSEWSAD